MDFVVIVGRTYCCCGGTLTIANAIVIHPQRHRVPCHRFGEFEKFIYDFLVGSEAAAGGAGGSLRGGEGLRLKLQTPLFVADALMEAARGRLEAQTAAAKRELASLESVRQQLARFKVRLEQCRMWCIYRVEDFAQN